MINMEIAEMILSQAGFAVETAENEQEALENVSGDLLQSFPARDQCNGAEMKKSAFQEIADVSKQFSDAVIFT